MTTGAVSEVADTEVESAVCDKVPVTLLSDLPMMVTETSERKCDALSSIVLPTEDNCWLVGIEAMEDEVFEMSADDCEDSGMGTWLVGSVSCVDT